MKAKFTKNGWMAATEKQKMAKQKALVLQTLNNQVNMSIFHKEFSLSYQFIQSYVDNSSGTCKMTLDRWNFLANSWMNSADGNASVLKLRRAKMKAMDSILCWYIAAHQMSEFPKQSLVTIWLLRRINYVLTFSFAWHLNLLMKKAFPSKWCSKPCENLIFF